MTLHQAQTLNVERINLKECREQSDSLTVDISKAFDIIDTQEEALLSKDKELNTLSIMLSNQDTVITEYKIVDAQNKIAHTKLIRRNKFLKVIVATLSTATTILLIRK